MEILYEDNHLLVVVKPANMPVNEDESGDPDLLSVLKDYLKEKYHKPGNVYLGLVHRLDRPVGGVMVFAKTSKAASRLAESQRKKEFRKEYYAVVCGKAAQHKRLEDYLLKDPKTNTSKVVDPSKGKKCVLEYDCIKQVSDLSLVKVQLETGRSHQIRVQMAHDHLPLWGDQKYNRQAVAGQQIALFAYMLSFPHPITKEIMTFTAQPKNEKPWSLFNQKGGKNE